MTSFERRKKCGGKDQARYGYMKVMGILDFSIVKPFIDFDGIELRC